MFSGGAGSPARRAFSAVFIGVVALILAGGYFVQARTYLNHDVSWVLYSSRTMLTGAVFGRDIVAANPPLIWWVSLLPNLVAKLLGSQVVPTFRLFVMALIAASLWTCDRLLVAAGTRPLARLTFAATIAYLAVISVARDFGQREQLSMLLVLPYILLAALRADGREVSRAVAIFIGAAAGIGVAFKPYFLLVPGLIELALLWRSRRIGVLFRPETLAAGLAVGLYLVAIFLLARPWWSSALPDIAKVYWAFDQPAADRLVPLLLRFGPPALVTLALLWRRPSGVVLMLYLVAWGYFGAAVVQQKYYSYHLYPAFALLLSALAVAYTAERLPLFLAIPAFLVFAVAVVQDVERATASIADRLPEGSVGEEIRQTVDYVHDHVPPGGSFLAISTHPFPGFPTALYADRDWASASNSRIFLPAVVRLRLGETTRDAATLAFAEQRDREALIRDLSRHPALVLVDNRPVRHAIGTARFDFLGYYLEDQRVRSLWSAYRHVDDGPAGFDAYVINQGAGK